MKTPCEQNGYKVGDAFRLLESRCGFTKGQIITLIEDDGDDCPLFSGHNPDHDGEAYVSIDFVVPVNSTKYAIISHIDDTKAQLDVLRNEILELGNRWGRPWK